MTPAPTGPLRDAQRRRASASCCLFRVQKKMAAGARCDDEMTSLRFDDGGCAAMTPAKGEALRASLMSFRHFVITPRSGEVMASSVKNQRSLTFSKSMLDYQEVSDRVVGAGLPAMRRLVATNA